MIQKIYAKFFATKFFAIEKDQKIRRLRKHM